MLFKVIFAVVITFAVSAYFYNDANEQGEKTTDTVYLNTFINTVTVAIDERKRDDTTANKTHAGAYADTIADYITDKDVVLDNTVSGAGSFLTHRKLRGLKVYLSPDQIGTYPNSAVKTVWDARERKLLEAKSDAEAKNFENKIKNIFEGKYPDTTLTIDGTATAIGASNTNLTATTINSDMSIGIGAIR